MKKILVNDVEYTLEFGFGAVAVSYTHLTLPTT